jgi:hypothetical protein
MAKKKTKKKNFVKSDLWRLLQIFCGIGIIISLLLLALELTKPMEITDSFNDHVDVNLFGTAETSEIYTLSSPESDSITIRSGLFKPETQLNDKPLADKTIQSIKSKLVLQCIMDWEGESVAFVKIQGEGLKKCCVGDTVSDLFTVKSIQEKSIKILIVDHEVKLTL